MILQRKNLNACDKNEWRSQYQITFVIINLIYLLSFKSKLFALHSMLCHILKEKSSVLEVHHPLSYRLKWTRDRYKFI